MKVLGGRIEHISGGPLAGGGARTDYGVRPEPTSGTGTALSSVGMLAMALRFNEERPGHSMLLAGHADSVGSDKLNDKLSTQRAELTHAVLTGNRDKFVEIANETGKVSDWKQIFKWSAAAFPAVPSLQVLDGDAPDEDEDADAAFIQLFDDLSRWTSGSLSLEEFVAIFMIVSNETGGTYKPVSEKGTLAYMFYLNKGPNRLAGDLLLERKKLTTAEQPLVWNKKGKDNFPGVGTDGITEDDLEECDFWKFRGRGFVQTTLRTIYLDRVDPVLKAANLSPSDDLTSDELDEAVLTNDKVYYPLLAKEVSSRKASLVKANAEEWKPFGYAVAGQNNHSYAALYEWRCQELYKALRAAAEAGTLSLS